MGRLILLLLLGAVGLVVVVVKSVAGKVTGNESLKNSTLQGETKKVMVKTAKGISWMEEQWEQSKKEADSSKKL